MKSVALVLLILLYPAIIWFAHGKIDPRVLALLLVVAVVTRLMTSPLASPSLKIKKINHKWLAGAAVLVGGLIWFNASFSLKLYPVLVNATMLGIFVYSLIKPPTMIERMARLTDPALPAYAIAYTRRVTQVWCGFFLLNGVVALVTACWASLGIWSLYNGVIAYVLMGILFAGEYIVRIFIKRRHRLEYKVHKAET